MRASESSPAAERVLESSLAFGPTCLVALFSAALMILALPPINAWFAAFFIPAPLAFLAIRARSTRFAVLMAIATQWLMWLWLLRWIIPVTIVGYPFLALYMSIYAGLFVWVMRRISRHRTMCHWPSSLVLPIVWTGMEFMRGDLAFNGYPWYFIAHPLIAVPQLVQSADLFGTYFISFLAAMVGGLALDVIRARSNPPLAASQRSFIPNLKIPIAFTALVVTLNFIYGQWRMNQTSRLSPGPMILAIQTNLPQDNKTEWTREAQARDLQQFIALTREAFAACDPKPDLIVWPETMVPGVGFDEQTLQHLAQLSDTQHLSRWPHELQALSRELGTPLLLGSNAWIDSRLIPLEDSRIRLEPGFEYNSAFLIANDPPYQRYDKVVLTPFGETMPYISNWPWLEEQMLAFGAQGMSFDLDASDAIEIINLRWMRRDETNGAQATSSTRETALATPICFEDTVGWYVRRMVYDSATSQKRADVIVNLSNDGWFNASRYDRIFHAQIARFRCIENRVPMVRSVNTGVSVAIDSTGRLTRSVEGPGTGYGQDRRPGWVAAPVMLDARQTLYGRIGNVWPWTCLAATIIALVWSFFSTRSTRGGA